MYKQQFDLGKIIIIQLMQRRHNSVTKLPEISIKKKDNIIKACRKFDQEMKMVEQKQQSNIQTMTKFDFLYGSQRKSYVSKKYLLEEARGQLEKQIVLYDEKQKDEVNDQRLKSSSLNKRIKIKIRQKAQKQTQIVKMKLAETKQFAYKTPQKLNLRELAEIQSAMDIKANSKRKKSAIVIKSERQKQVLPFYSVQQNKMIEISYTKIREVADRQKVKIRMSNGMIKQVNRNTIYYKVGDSEQQQQKQHQKQQSAELEEQIKNCQINIDYSLLNEIMGRVSKEVPASRRQELMEDLIQNYKMSVNIFNNNFKKPGWLKNKIKHINALTVQRSIVHSLQTNLVCSDQLHFLNIFGLDKRSYLHLLVQAQNIVRSLEQFIHFDIFQLITILNNQKLNNTSSPQNNQNKEDSEEDRSNEEVVQVKQAEVVKTEKPMLNPAEHYKASKMITSENVDGHLRNKKSQIQLKIYSMQQQIEKIKNTLYKHIEHVIKLNPKLVGTPYEEYTRVFTNKFSKFLGVTLRSILSHAVYQQLQKLGNYFLQYFDLEFNGVLSPNHPNTQFYTCITKINQPFRTPFSKTQILHGPVLIMLDAKIKKMKRKTLRNVYKFLIDSRKQIRAYPHKLNQNNEGKKKDHRQSALHQAQNANPILLNKQRIYFNSCYDILKAHIIEPIQKYIEIYLSNSQNINGCISNINLDIHRYGEFEKFVDKIKLLSDKIEQTVIQKYQQYFSYWELYLMQRPYIEQMIILFKRINGIRLMQDEMRNLESDLQIIKEFPNVIQDKVVRIDITEVKQRIISTITINIKQIGKASEEVLQRLLSIGQAQTLKARKLNQITPYSTIAEYINFAKALSSRGVERSIQRVALNAVVLTQNWNFLEQNNFPVRTKIMGQYLESCIWVRMLRKAANANRMKLTVDPQIFSNGVIEKKYKIYYKYMFLVKEIAEIIKLTQIAHWDRYSALSKNIYSELQEIVSIAKDISQEEDLLRIEYYDDTGEKSINGSKREEGTDLKIATTSQQKSRSSLKQNFIFFFKEKVYISKFAKFWQYVIKFKNQVDDLNRLTLYEIHGENILKVIREGQQILHELKITSVNKRLLGLVEKIYKQMEPYVRHSRVIKVLCNGSQNARTRSLVELKKQIGDHIQRKKKQIQQRKRKAEEQQLKKQMQSAAENKESDQNIVQVTANQQNHMKTKQQPNIESKQKQEQKKTQLVDQEQFDRAVLSNLESFLKLEEMHITLKQLVETPIPTLDFTPFYQLYMAERRKQQVMAKVKKISHQIKLIDVKITTISVIQPLPTIEFLEIPPNLIHYISEQNRQMLDIVSELTQNGKDQMNSQLSQVYEEYFKEVQHCSKKLSIFNASLQKMKKVEPYMYELYSWFQLILPSLMPASSSLSAQFRPFYEQFSLEYNKKLQIIKKLGYTNLYEDRVRINYEKQLQKFEEMKIKLYNHPTFGMMALNKNHAFCCANSIQHLFAYFGNLSAVLFKAQDAQNQKKVEDTLKNLYKESYNRRVVHLDYCLPHGIQNLSFIIRYNDKQKCFYIRGNRFSTAHHQLIVLNEPAQAPTSLQKNKTNNRKQSSENQLKQQKLFSVEHGQSNIVADPESDQPPAQIYICQSGILTTISKLSKLIESALQAQVLELLPIVYQFHYNIKDVFTMYITLGNCLFQALITSLYAVFYMDLLLVWENDYDILVLKEKIRDCYQNGFEAKESQNNRLVEEIYKCYEIFIGIIDMIVRRKTQQTDRQIEGPNIQVQKIRKKLIIEFIPVLMFEQFESPKNRKKNRQWLLLLKKDKQDDFINQTHLNPAFQDIMNSMNFSNTRVREIMDRVQIKQIEKKDEILVSKLSESIFRGIPIASNPIKKTQKKNTKQKECRLVVMGYSNYKVQYGYQIIKSVSNTYENTESTINATWLITQAQRHSKILITNCHPNRQILGRNIVNRWIKLSRNSTLRQYKKLEESMMKAKRQKQIQIRDDGMSLNSNSSLRNSMMSVDTPRIQRKITIVTPNKKQMKSVLSTNIYQLDESPDYEYLGNVVENQVEMLNQYATTIMDAIRYNPSCCYCIHVQDEESLGWVVDYLVALSTSITQQQHMPMLYIYCMQINTDYLQKLANLERCLVYIKDYEANSNAVINTPYSQNRLFTHKSTTHKDPLGSKLKDVLGSETANNSNTNEGTSAFLPLPTHLHTNPLLLQYSSLYPYSSITTGTKIYQNTLLYPILISQSSSPNILRSPMNPKYRQLVHKNIINYYTQLKIQQYLQLPFMQPIVHALHYNAFIVPSSNTTEGGLLHNYSKYIVNNQIKQVMSRVWYLLMEQINRMQMGQPINANHTTNSQLNNVDLYLVPVHAMSVGQLIGELTLNVSSHNMSYSRVAKQGTIQHILKLAVMATNLVSGDKTPTPMHSSPIAQKYDPILLSLHQYLIHTHHDTHTDHDHPPPQSPTSLNHTLPTCRWFVLDLSVYNDTTVYVYNWLCTSFIQNMFVFMNQHTVQWNHNACMRVAYAKKNQYNSSHGTANLMNMHLVKIVILAHPKLLDNTKNGGMGQLQPLPVLDLLSNYNPILQISQQLPKLLTLLRTPSTNIPPIPSILQLIFKILLYTPEQPEQQIPGTEKSLYNKLTPTIVQNLLIKFRILINQLRKCRLANGLYTETEVGDQDKKDILMCSIELREKVKSSYQAMTEMLEIQKQLDGERKDMYKMYVSIFNAVVNINATQGRQISFNPNYLNIEHLKQYIKQNPLSKNMQAQCQKNLKILDQKLISDIGFDTIAKIIVQGLYSTLSAYCTSAQQKQALSKQILSVFAAKTNQQTKESPKKKINKKMGRNKKNDSAGVTINHPNLLSLPVLHSTPTMPQPTPFSLTQYFYNIATDSWQKWHQLSPFFLLPTSINCSANTHKQALHPAQMLRLNPYINIGVKQSILKNFCNAGGIHYDMNVMKNYLDEDIVWSHYLIVYGVITTVIRVADSDQLAHSYGDMHFYNRVQNKNSIFNGEQAIQIRIDKSNADVVENWLQMKHETLLNYHMFHQKLSTAALASNQEYANSNNNQDSGHAGSEWHVLAHKYTVNAHKIFVFHVITNTLHHTPQPIKQIVSRYCCGMPILKIPTTTQQQTVTKTIGRINPILQTYMKYKNITSITQLLLSQDTSTQSNKKHKPSTQTKHHAHNPTPQQHQQYKQQLCHIAQLHLRRLIAIMSVQEERGRSVGYYERMMRILVQVSSKDDADANRYYTDFDAYGIQLGPDRLDEIYDIYWMMVTAMRQQKLMKNHLLMNNNPVTNSIENNAIDQFRAKADESIGLAIYKYLENSPTAIFHHSEYLAYIPRYLLPKPKKYKSSSTILAESNLVNNGYFAELLKLDDLSKLAPNQQQRQSNEVGENANKDKPKPQQTNQIYTTKLYKVQDSYANIYQLNENTIISVVKANQQDVGAVNVSYFITGFLLYTKSRIFIQSQLMAQQSTITASPKPNASEPGNNSLHYSNINKGVTGYNKQFSLWDAKVSRIINQYWRSQRKPNIKIVYKCLYSCNSESYQQEIKWIAELDANNNQTYTYQQQQQQQQQQGREIQRTISITARSRVKTNNKHKNNTSYSRSMMSNLSENQERDNVMGIITFIQVVNQAIHVDDVMKLFESEGGNQYCIVLMHDNKKSLQNSQSVSSHANDHKVSKQMRQKLAGYFWLIHQPNHQKQINQQKIQNQYPNDIPPHLTTIYTRKYLQILQKLSQLHVNKFTSYYIPQGVIGKVYIPAIGRKRQQIKDVIVDKRQERASKKEVYDNCRMEIQTLRNKIQESELTIKSNADKIGQWSVLLANFSAKLEKYVGDQQFKQVKQSILQIPRKTIEKQVLKSAYIEDNPLNLSFIYRFNVLADNTYFPDKNFQVYEHVYKISGKYAVFEEQKKQFIKLFNMGRLNIMLENDDYWPNQDQILSSEKVRKQFEYLGPIGINNQNQGASFSLTNLLLKQQLKFIAQKAQTPVQQIFHRYLCFLSAHSYVKHYLISNKIKLEKNIKDCEEESKILTNKIKDYKLMLKQQEEKQVNYKSKYDRSIEQVHYCEENERIFTQIANKNVAKLSEVLEHNVFGVKGVEKQKALKEIAQFLVYGISKNCQECLRKQKLKSGQNKAYHPLSVQARRYLFYLVGIPTVKTKILSYKTESVSSLYDSLYVHLLKQELRIQANLVFHSCHKFEEQKYKSGIDDRHYNIVTHGSTEEAFVNQQQLQNTIAAQIFPQFAQEPTNLLRKLERIEGLLEGSFQKFVEKIDLIHSKQLQSIRKFEINDEMVTSVLQGFKNQTLQFEGLNYLGDWKIRNKASADLCAAFATLLSNAETVKYILNKLRIPQQFYKQIATHRSLKYYCKLLGQTIRRSNQIPQLLSATNQVIKSTLFSMIKQFIYNHTQLIFKSFLPQNKFRVSQEIIEEQILHKQPIEKLVKIEEDKVANELCLLDSVLALNYSIVYIEADSELEQMLVRKASKNNYEIVWKQIKFMQQQKTKNKQQKIRINTEQDRNQQSESKVQEQQSDQSKQKIPSKYFEYFHSIEDTTTQHWIIYYIHHRTFNDFSQIKLNHEKLEDDIKKNKQQNIKYLFIIRDAEVISYVEIQVQPVYRMYSNNNIFAKLRHEEYGTASKDKVKDKKQSIRERSSVQLGIQLIGKLFEYYSQVIFAHCNRTSRGQKRNFLNLFTKNIQTLKSQPIEQKAVVDQNDPEPEQQEDKLINEDRILYPKPECIPMLYRLLQSNPLVISSSFQYRTLKKLISLLFADDEQAFDILQGYQIFQSYFSEDLTQAKYKNDHIKLAVEQVHRNRNTEQLIQENKDEVQQLNEQQLQRVKQVNKMKQRYEKFIVFIQTVHERCCLGFQFSSQKNSNKLQKALLLTQDFLGQPHLIQNKTQYSTKVKDPTEQIIKSLFVKSNPTSQPKSIKSSFSQIYSNQSLLLADPKIYIILNKTLKKALNKVAIAKHNKKSSVGSKEGKVKRKLLPNIKQAQKMLGNQIFFNLFESISSFHRIQFLMWMFSQSENIKMNNICFSVKPKITNQFQQTGSEQQNEIKSEPKQLTQDLIQQKIVNNSFLSHCFKFELRCVNGDELLFPAYKKVSQVVELSSCQIQVEVFPMELNKSNRPYRGLLFKYEGQFKQIEDSALNSFKVMSGFKEDQFLRPNLGQGSKEQSREGSSPSISKQQMGSESPSSPATRMTRHRKNASMMGQTMKQTTNLSKLSYFILPIYSNQIQIGVLQIDLRLCKGFDPIRSYAILK